uniref:Peptidyl-prolyl cis-trans isomerase n=1 Tax=Desulfatirhabdium butyrativorans TaxID=340467 RepID=A0A7C4RRW6_9BACT
MITAQIGNHVKVHYTGKLENGEIFDSSIDREPLEFELGTDGIIAGFQQGILGMAEGEKKTLRIAPEDAYGPYHEEGVMELDRSLLPADVPLEIGLGLQLRNPDGDVFNVMVKNVTEDKVTFDANHPLAGQTLIMDVELVEIKPNIVLAR